MIAGAIILAGGQGRRFGADKRRAQLPNGDELLAATVRRYAEVFAHLRVALRPGDDALAAHLAPLLRSSDKKLLHGADQQLFRAPRADGGMGFTLADCISTVPTWQFAWVALGDMPFVTYTTLCRLRDSCTGTASWDVLQPTYLEQPGHPVGFRHALFAELVRLRGDEGARLVVQQHKQRRVRLEVFDPGVLQDVDTPAALAAPGTRPPDRTSGR